MNTAEFNAMIGAVEEGAQPVPTLDDYTAALATLHRSEQEQVDARMVNSGATERQMLRLTDENRISYDELRAAVLQEIRRRNQ